ncbi:MAG: hypothetical protein AAGB07_15315 [Pseudomonadota bacterium]
MVFSLFKSKEPAFDEDLVRQIQPRKPNVASDIVNLTRKERVKRAFDEMPLDARETEAVCALLDQPGSTCVELSRACGWMDTRWRMQMLMLCQRRRKYLWPEGVTADISNGLIISALAEYDTYAGTFSPRKDVKKRLRKAVQAAL